MPLFVRAGAIIPMMKEARRIPEGRIDPLELKLYPSGSSSWALFEEEGRTDFRLEAVGRACSLEWSGPFPRAFIVRVGRKSFRLPRSKKGKVRLPVSLA